MKSSRASPLKRLDKDTVHTASLRKAGKLTEVKVNETLS